MSQFNLHLYDDDGRLIEDFGRGYANPLEVLERCIKVLKETEPKPEPVESEENELNGIQIPKNKVRQTSIEHAKWFTEIIKPLLASSFEHGYKHGYEDAVNKLDRRCPAGGGKDGL